MTPAARLAQLVRIVGDFQTRGANVVALKTLRAYTRNALTVRAAASVGRSGSGANARAQKEDPKYRCIKQSNAAFRDRVLAVPGGKQVLLTAGFRAGTGEDGEPVLRLEEVDRELLAAAVQAIEAELRRHV